MAPKRSRCDEADACSTWVKDMLTKWEEYLERIVKEKECRITWVGIEEKGTPQATAAFDREAIKEVIDASGDDELVAEWTNRRIDVVFP
ncbi:unnamed protein product [Cylicocyclus nassatus]|uniref:Uncharacterized protein n=1 Tax=Cylicocyclus nassatus TaxID=53992 RepID=A0AA36GX03_CYLNA|nr:unnamed protein product [Cylicocyclus nassatus]